MYRALNKIFIFNNYNYELNLIKNNIKESIFNLKQLFK